MSLVQEETRVRGDGSLEAIIVRCMECGRTVPADQPVSQCETCGGLLDVELTFPQPLGPRDLEITLPLSLRQSGVWRYRRLLPALPDEAIVSRAEGNTPIYWDQRLARYAGLERIGFKHEGQNPTASFKDRGMTVGVSHAVAVGARIVACASTGNTSASLASYAAAAGLAALVLIPEGKIAGGKLAQTIAHGARIVQVQGDFDAALALLRELTAAYPVYLVNSVNPFRLEGQKTIVFELLEQLDWVIPDVIALPGGNLGNTAAFGKALSDLWNAGLIDRMPRLATIQAAGAAPFADYFASGFDRYRPVVAETVATAIKIGNPASIERARRAIQLTDGVVTSVTDDEILDAKAEIDRVGIGCEPASAASLAGVRRLVREGVIAPDATVVGILTGHVLKDADAVVSYHLQDHEGQMRPGANRPVTIPAELAALERTLADALHG
ncbi:MAG: threonine synthase [Thermomicrobiales bacterium]|jgi:threonine synthase|nr:threonine synthase [Thermomicrobiales bacterium]